MTERARGPWTECRPMPQRPRHALGGGGIMLHLPGDGRRPTTPQKAAGLRNEPPRSLPVASHAAPTARAAVEPPLEPPAVRERSWGLQVVPKTSLKVCEPAACSGMLDKPITMPPAASRSSTIEWLLVMTREARARSPAVHRTPAMG